MSNDQISSLEFVPSPFATAIRDGYQIDEADLLPPRQSDELAERKAQ